MYLQNKEDSEFDGDEVSVWNAYSVGSDSFMPNKKTLFMNVIMSF